MNAPRWRSQDQLHVHIVQLRLVARARLASRPTARVAQLDSVWETAARLAGGTGLAEYGVLVAQASMDDFVVLADPGNVEREFTESRCR